MDRSTITSIVLRMALPEEGQATVLRLLRTVADSDMAQAPGPNGK